MNRSILASAAFVLAALPAVSAAAQYPSGSAQTGTPPSGDQESTSSSSPLDSLRQSQRGNRQNRQQQQQPAHLQINGLGREESDAILPTYQAVQAQDWAAAAAALPAAQAGARTPAGRYVVGQLQLQIARNTNNNQMALQAVDAMINSGGAPAEQMEALRNARTSLTAATTAQTDPAAAEGQLTQMLAASPANAQLMLQLAEVKERLNKHQEAVQLFQRAIAAAGTGGQAAPQDYYRRALSIAYRARLVQPSVELTSALVAAYPTQDNWRDSLRVYRDLSSGDRSSELDLFRLMRAAGALASEAEYVTYAEVANRAVALGEVKAVLDEAFARNMVQASNAASVRELLTSANSRMAADRSSLATESRNPATGQIALRLGDAYYGYGDYAQAAQLYRTALQKGGQDANQVNLRLGEALAMGGQRAEAEAALRAVSGPRQAIAAYWLLFLAHPPQGQSQPQAGAQ